MHPLGLSERFLAHANVAIQLASPLDYLQDSSVRNRLRSLASQLEWGDRATGCFSKVVPEGARVVVKPNFVLHENQGPWSFEPVITHPSLIRATVSELLLTRAAEVMVGDAPVQSCDFDVLLNRTGLGQWAAELSTRESRFTGIHDFRRTVSVFQNYIRVASENRIDLSRYVLFDLAQESLLEPVTSSEPCFRVTCYNPELLARTHFQGHHQYLIAKAVLDADVVVNLPKLKMHRKAGVTNALKNLVGINGNKEFLPHHRIGGSADAGDCYPGRNRVKRLAEVLLDFKNSSSSVSRSKIVNHALRPLNAMLKIGGDETGLEGSWSGNDTVWRMTLDLNRILVYGKPDGTMAETPQRTILHLSDGIIAGQGCGPLAPEPFELGVLLAGYNPAAMDWVGALLLNFDPEKISLLTGAFDNYRWPLARFGPESIKVIMDHRLGSVEEMFSTINIPLPTQVPPGWTSVVRSANRGSDHLDGMPVSRVP